MKIEVGKTYLDGYGYECTIQSRSGEVYLDQDGYSYTGEGKYLYNGAISHSGICHLKEEVRKEADATKETNSDCYPTQRFETLIAETWDAIIELVDLKGGEYSGDDDRLANFRRNGKNLDLPMETIWSVYAAKHWDAISQYVKDLQQGKSRERMESLDGRVDDLIVYLLLFKAMIEERENAPNEN